MYWLLREASPLVHPVGFVWLGLVVGGCVAWRRHHRGVATVCLGIALSGSLLIQPWALKRALENLERPWADYSLEQAPAADAVVVLGGGWRVSDHDLRLLDFTAAGDRLLAGIELCRRKRAPVLLLGGDLALQPVGYAPDSSQIQTLLKDWGIAPAEVVSLGIVATTRDEAEQTRKLVEARGWKRVLLVTSAFHMTRASRTFAKAGIPFHPVACDFQMLRLPVKFSWRHLRICPGAEDLNNLTLWWHEFLGSLVYQLTGAG